MSKPNAIALISALLISNIAFSKTNTNESFTVDLDWMNKVVNLTPAKKGACPILEIDKYKDGFKVARKRNFYGSIGAGLSKWYPKNEIWAAVGLAPVKESFGVVYTKAVTVKDIEKTKRKKLPNKASMLNKWSVDDSAYWESTGGIAFFLGAGHVPIYAGTMVVAKGGFSHYVKKTGPNTVYVETSKKKVKSAEISAGSYLVSVSLEKIKDSAIDGVAYEMDIRNPQVRVAYEKLIAGDLTAAQTLSEEGVSGIKQVATSEEFRDGFSRSWRIGTPIIPIISYKSSSARYYDRSSEKSAWDEIKNKEYGVYIKNKSSRFIGLHRNITKTYYGGKELTDDPNYDDGSHGANRIKKSSMFSKFSYHYEADLGQERRLRMHLKKMQRATGLTAETCVKVPEIKKSLKYNQIKLELELSDKYVKQLIGRRKNNVNLVNLLKRDARKLITRHFNSKNNNKEKYLKYCNMNAERGMRKSECINSQVKAVNKSFNKISKYARAAGSNYNKNQRVFAKNMAKIGETVWKNPFVFRAIYERSKKCGAEFNFEVSGRRLTRHYINKKFKYSSNCLR